MKTELIIVLTTLTITFVALCGVYWFKTQPVRVVDKEVEQIVLENLPPKNRLIIELIESNGRNLAPTYKTAVCTEFVINVIDRFDSLTKTEKTAIRIITNAKLDSLIESESPIIKGVQTALIKGGKGTEIIDVNDVLPGDLVQFWNIFQGEARGHCGIVLHIDPYKSISLYSSHPFTNGYGKQEYLWPEWIYFARLN